MLSSKCSRFFARQALRLGLVGLVLGSGLWAESLELPRLRLRKDPLSRRLRQELESGLNSTLGPQAPGSTSRHSFLVRFRGRPPSSPLRHGGSRFRDLPVIHGAKLELTPREALAWADSGEISLMVKDPAFPILPARPAGVPQAAIASAQPWSLAALELASPGARHGLSGEGVVVGHIDTGVDPNHPSLQGHVVGFRDFTETAREKAFDDHGHGTHTLALVLGRDPSAVAPKAKALVARALDSTGQGRLSDLLASLQWMLDPDGDPKTKDNPTVVSASWGVPRSLLEAEEVDLNFFWDALEALREAGTLVVFASGNEGPGVEYIPGSYRQVMAVGAVNRNLEIAEFSSGTPRSAHGKPKPDLVAPGVSIASARSGGGRVRLSGTSQATPQIAGLLALVLEAQPQASPDDLESLVYENCRDLGSQGFDPRYGRGIPRGSRILALAQGAPVNPEPPPVVPPGGFEDPDPTPPEAGSRPLPPANAKNKGKWVGIFTGVALALGLGLLFFQGS